MLVYWVRDQLIQQVVNTCYHKYIEEQNIHYLVHCSCRALKVVVNLGCFYHDIGKPYYLNHIAWKPDIALEPSFSDLCLFSKVSIKAKEERFETIIPITESIDFGKPQLDENLFLDKKLDEQKVNDVEVLYQISDLRIVQQGSSLSNETSEIKSDESFASKITLINEEASHEESEHIIQVNLVFITLFINTK